MVILSCRHWWHLDLIKNILKPNFVIFTIKHVKRGGNSTIFVSNDGKINNALLSFVNIFNPGFMAFQPIFIIAGDSFILSRIARKTNDFDPSLTPLFGKFCDSSEFSSAYWSEIFWVREQDAPAVFLEFMEIDGPLTVILTDQLF